MSTSAVSMVGSGFGGQGSRGSDSAGPSPGHSHDVRPAHPCDGSWFCGQGCGGSASRLCLGPYAVFALQSGPSPSQPILLLNATAHLPADPSHSPGRAHPACGGPGPVSMEVLPTCPSAPSGTSSGEWGGG